MKTPFTLIFALVLSFIAPASHAGEFKGNWTISPSTEAGQVQFSLIHRHDGGYSQSQSDWPVSEFQGLDLSTRTSAYAFLVGRTCDAPSLPGEPERNYVRPYDPDGSQLVHMLRGDEIRLMPPDQPLPEVEISLVERWILEGAPCD